MSKLDEILKRSSQLTKRQVHTMIRHRMSDAKAQAVESLSEPRRIVPDKYLQYYNHLLETNAAKAQQWFDLVSITNGFEPETRADVNRAIEASYNGMKVFKRRI